MVSGDWRRSTSTPGWCGQALPAVPGVTRPRNSLGCSVEPALGKATEAVLRAELLLAIGIGIDTYVTFSLSERAPEFFFNSLITFAKRKDV